MKFIAIINLLIAILTMVLLLSALSGGLVSILGSPIVILVILFLVFLGLINSIVYIWKKNWKLRGESKMTKLFFAIPIVNTFIFLVGSSLLG